MPVKLNRKKANPTPAQLEARRLFAERARSGAFKKKATKRKAKNPGVIRLSESDLKRYGGKIKGVGSVSGSPAPRRKKQKTFKKPAKRALARAFSGSGFLGLGRSRKTISVNPGGEHLPGLPKKFQRMYEDVLKSAQESGRYKGREKEVAARTVKAAAHGRANPYPALARANPSWFSMKRGKGRKARRRYTKQTGKDFPMRGVAQIIGTRPAKRLASSQLPNPRKPSKRQRRERRIVRARRQQVVYRRQHGAPARSKVRGLPNPVRGTYEVMGFKKSRKSGLATGRRKTVGTVKAFTRWGAQRKAARMEKKFGMFLGASKRVKRRGRKKVYGLFNPSPANVFSEFRGKGATTKTKATAATGTPRVLAKLGTLQELHVRGKRLNFGGSAALAADGRKKLHITGARFAKPNPPGEVDYGEILSVVYRADKPHIETGVFDYKHHFGEDGGRRPHLIVDAEGYPKIEGGDYKIDADGIID